MFLRLRNTTPKETWFSVTGCSFGVLKMVLIGWPKRPQDFRLVDESTATYDRLYMPTTLNPAFRMANSHQSVFQRVTHGEQEALSIRLPKAALRGHSSVLNMYISDPPCRKAMLQLLEVPEKLSQIAWSQITSDKGLKVRDVVEAAARFEAEHCPGPDHDLLWKRIRKPLSVFRWSDDGESDDGDHDTESVYDGDFITLGIDLPFDGRLQPVIPSEEERAVVALKHR